MPLLTPCDAAALGSQPLQSQPTAPPVLQDLTLTSLQSRWVSSSLGRFGSEHVDTAPPSRHRSSGKAEPAVALFGSEVSDRPLQDDETGNSFQTPAGRCVFIS